MTLSTPLLSNLTTNTLNIRRLKCVPYKLSVFQMREKKVIFSISETLTYISFLYFSDHKTQCFFYVMFSTLEQFLKDKVNQTNNRTKKIGIISRIMQYIFRRNTTTLNLILRLLKLRKSKSSPTFKEQKDNVK